jgi:acyl-CoA thioester hydrolase
MPEAGPIKMAIKNLPSVAVNLRVPFHHLDPLGVVWHGNYLKYFDIARFALFAQQGVDLYRLHQQTHYILPVIKTDVKYVHPLYHGDEFICQATLAQANIKIVLNFEIRLIKNGQLCAKGTGEQVAVKLPDMEMMLRLPDEIRMALGLMA